MTHECKFGLADILSSSYTRLEPVFDLLSSGLSLLLCLIVLISTLLSINDIEYSAPQLDGGLLRLLNQLDHLLVIDFDLPQSILLLLLQFYLE